MTPDEELIVIFGVLHLVALGLGVLMFVMFLRTESSDPQHGPEEDDGGGGGNDRVSAGPKTSPSGGIPLPDAQPARRRLRSHERLRDSRARPSRRQAPEPEPARRHVRQR